MSRILVIDDNELIGRMMLESLTEYGYEARIAVDANQGYKDAVDFHPDLILLDVQLPDATGFDLCRMLKNRSELRSVPIIMITGSARSTEEKVKGFQLGIDDYLIKPVEMPELLERIRAVLRRSESRQTPKPMIKPTAQTASASPAAPTTERTLPWQAIVKILTAPLELPSKLFAPGISLVVLLVGMSLYLGAMALSAGPDLSAAVVGLLILGMWGLATTVLVMASTLAGVSITWKEGAGVISLAAAPLLLKSAGALVMSLVTTLSPFVYSAGVPLAWDGAPAWLARLDLFEIWSAVLLWWLLRQWPSSSKKKAWMITGFVWCACAALAIAVGGSR